MTGQSLDIESVDFAKGGGLVTVVAQHDETGEVLMVAHADREALSLTIATGEMHYHSRSRGLWHKGATSGNVQRVVSLDLDCDKDSVLARVAPAGPACHTGGRTCFGSSGSGAFARASMLSRLDATIAERARDATDSPSYTRKLLSDRNLRLKKIGEEAAELVVAAADGDSERAVEEAADLFYHSLVVLRALGTGTEDVDRVLARRQEPR